MIAWWVELGVSGVKTGWANVVPYCVTVGDGPTVTVGLGYAKGEARQSGAVNLVGRYSIVRLG